MSITPYAVGVSALAVGLAVGYVKYMERDVTADKAEAKTAIVRAECSTNVADEVTQSALQQVATLTREVERQKAIAAAEAKKSRQRLDAFNALNRKIGNVPTSENVPVSSHIESVLDSVRSAVPRDTSADGADKDGVDGNAGPDRPNVPAEADPAPETPIG